MDDKMIRILHDATVQAQVALDVLIAEPIGPSFVQKAKVRVSMDFKAGK